METGIGEIDHLDLYSCFPSAVGVASRELGIDPFSPGRNPTTTGGLSFAGGPGSNYVTHSIAALCERIATAGGTALATAVGWYLTKHGVVGLSEPGAPGGRWEHIDPQPQIDAGPRLEVLPAPEEGVAAIEAYTAICNRDGDPELGIATFVLDGGRTVAKADDASTLGILADRDCLGAAARFSGGGRFTLPSSPERPARVRVALAARLGRAAASHASSSIIAPSWARSASSRSSPSGLKAESALGTARPSGMTLAPATSSTLRASAIAQSHPKRLLSAPITAAGLPVSGALACSGTPVRRSSRSRS